FERVLEFHSDIRIAANGELTVTERIAVQAEGREIRRGILRDFPTRYRDRFGALARVVPFSVSAVMRDGKPEPYHLENLENGVRIRIGEANRFLPPGRHEYEITYRTGRQIGFFPEHDELYWNVNGNGWDLPLDKVSGPVSLPKAVPAGELRLEAYTGYAGVRGRHYEAEARDGGAAFRSTRPFNSTEGMTIVVAFPKDVVGAPAAHLRALWWLGDNPGPTAGAAGLLALLAFLYWRWSQVGRDPPAGPLFPRYEAPARVGAAGVRFIDRMGGYDVRCFAAGLLDLGARGFVKIEQSDGRYEVT